MPYFLGMLLVFGALYLFLAAFARADAGELSRALKALLIGLLCAAAIVFSVLERPGFGLLFAAVAGMLIWRRRQKAQLLTRGKAPAMRSPWLELRLREQPRRIKRSPERRSELCRTRKGGDPP